MENKKNKLLILMIVLCIMVPIGGAIAYFRADTSSSNKLSSGNIGIELRDATTNEDGQITDEGINFNFGYPGAIKDKQTFVKNTSENDLYTRIAVTKYWEDESGNKVIDANPGFIEIITNDKDNWIIQDSDENKEVVYFYYTTAATEPDKTSIGTDSKTQWVKISEEEFKALDDENNNIKATFKRAEVKSNGLYDNAEYTLTITAQVSQANKEAAATWITDATNQTVKNFLNGLPTVNN